MCSLPLDLYPPCWHHCPPPCWHYPPNGFSEGYPEFMRNLNLAYAADPTTTLHGDITIFYLPCCGEFPICNKCHRIHAWDPYGIVDKCQELTDILKVF